MYNNPTVIALTVFSGLAGAILTQIITAANGYFTDKRKQTLELKNQYRAKMVEIGESFYYITGEKMASIKKNIGYWKSNNPFRTPETIEYLKKETLRFNTYMEKLDEENWKYNLIGLYFKVEYATEDVHKDNDRSKQLFLSYLDLGNVIIRASEEVDELIYQRFASTMLEMCAHYEMIYSKLEKDKNAVKSQLLHRFDANQ